MTAETTRCVIIADPHPEEMAALASGLEGYGYGTARCLPEDWVSYVSNATVAALILGPHLTPLEVWQLAKDVRVYAQFPLVVLMEAQEPDSASLALDAGADYCIMGKDVVSARLILSAIHAIERRASMVRPSSDVIRAGDLKINLDRRTAELGGHLIPLTKTEYSILAILAQKPGRITSAHEILSQIHGDDAEGREAQDTIKVYISRLRQKLGKEAHRIVNMRGQGYMFERRNEPRDRPEAAAQRDEGAQPAARA